MVRIRVLGGEGATRSALLQTTVCRRVSRQQPPLFDDGTTPCCRSDPLYASRFKAVLASGQRTPAHVL